MRFPIPFFKSAIYSFKNSILLYPILLSIGSIVLFTITSRIDDSLGGTVNIPILDWLLFTGSPHAARSILSTIATAWATILGVAFSVTLISFQLSVTKHSSEVIDEFENDRLNQIMLGWFVSTVIYSLLVLKTVRVGEDDVVAFTPVIGVNIAVFLAIIALFIFVTFLHNVSRFFKPPVLIERIQRHVIEAMNLYRHLQVDRGASFVDIRSTGLELIRIRSPREGILRRVDLGKMKGIINHRDYALSIWVEFGKKRGDYLRKGSPIATIYGLTNKDHSFNKQAEEVTKNDSQELEKSINNILDISNNRDLLTDPVYGIEILRDIAVKSTSESDIRSTMSCISGLFGILTVAFETAELQVGPAVVRKSNNSIDEIQPLKNTLVVNLNEKPIYEIVLSELATIYRACLANIDQMGVILGHYSHEYRLRGIEFLVKDVKDVDHFSIVTKWYSELLSLSSDMISKDISNKYGIAQTITTTLETMREELQGDYPYATDIFDVHIGKVLADSTK